MPTRITFSDGRKIEFIYDATGKKWRKTVINANCTSNNYRDYIGDAEYLNGQQDIIHFTEGYAQRDITTDGDGVWNGWVYKYTLKDHLGNTRVTYSDKNKDGIVTTGDIEQVNNFYSFGFNMEGPWSGVDGAFKYGFNGKEWNDDFGLGWNHHDWRFYDPAIDRWWNLDPEGESGEQISFSPYHFSYDNPIRFSDPDGKEGEDCCKGLFDMAYKATSFIAGASVAIIDNLSGGNLDRAAFGNGFDSQNFNSGQDAGDIGSIAIGGSEIATGVTLTGSSSVVTIGTGGGSAPVTVPVAAGGVTLSVHGASVIAQGFTNLATQKGRVQVNSNSTTPSSSSPSPYANSTSGNNTAAQNGQKAHKDFSKKVDAKPGWKAGPTLIGKNGKTYRPDAMTPSGNLLELKPDTKRGRSRGKAQAKNYEEQLGRKTKVVYYKP